MIFLWRVQECWPNGAQRKAGPSKKVGYRVGLPFCPLCFPLLLLFLSTGLALLVWCCYAVYSLWPGQEGWEGSGWEAGAACPRLEGGRRLVQTQSPFVCQTSRAAGVGFLGGFFPPFFLFFYLRRIIALSRGSQDSKSLCRTAGQPRDVPLDQPQLPSPFPPARSLGRASL